MAKVMGFFTDAQMDSVGMNGAGSAACEKCGLSTSCKSPRMGYTGNGRKGILIVSECPSDHDDNSGTPFSGDTSKWFAEKLRKLGIDLHNDCWKTNAVGCHPKNEADKQPQRKHVIACSPRLMRTIEELKPRFIWLMGEKAITAYFHKRDNDPRCVRWRGLCVPDPDNKAWILPMYHPKYAMQQEKDENFQMVYNKDLSYAVRCSKFPDPPEEMSLKGARIIKDFDEAMDALESTLKICPEKFAFDYECTGLKPYRNAHRIATISWCSDWDTSYAIPYQYRQHFTQEQQDYIADVWTEIMLHKDIKKMAHNCFSGDTQFITRHGIKTFKEVVGTTQEVWTKSGWVPAEIKSFGNANLTKIVVGPSNRSMSSIKHEILCTDNHRWFIDHYTRTQYTTRPNSSVCRRLIVPTNKLKKRHRILAELPTYEIDEKSEGFIHGLIFADGCFVKQTKCGRFGHQIRLCGDKREYKNLFPKYTYPPSAAGDPVVNWYVADRNYKLLPSKEDSAEYVANFIEGWQRFDGTFATTGVSRVVTTMKEEEANWLKEHAAIGGWYCTGVTKYVPKKPEGFGKRMDPRWMISITKDEELGWTVKEVIPNVSYEEVFCAVVPELEQFTLNHGIYTLNSKYEDAWTRSFFGVEPNNVWWCTLNAAHILDTRKHFSGLKFQAHIRWGIPDYDSSMEKYLKTDDGTPFNRVMEAPLNDLLLYNSIDSLLTFRLQEEQEEDISKQPCLERGRAFFMDGLNVLCDMQENGVRADADYYKEQDLTLGKRIITLNETLHDMDEAKKFERVVGRSINFGSNADLSKLFYEILGYKATKQTSSGNDSTDKEALASLKSPLAAKIAEISKLEKIKGTYLAQFLRELDDDGRIHPFFDLHTTQTLRGSANSPNLQNIPVRDSEAMLITRGGLFPSLGKKLIDWDYGAMEVRVIASITQCPVLIKHINDPSTDMHRDQAMELFGFKPSEWDEFQKIDKKLMKNIRFHAKNGMVFALFYGSYYRSIARTLFALLKELKVPEVGTLFEWLRSKNIIRSLATAAQDFEDHVNKVEKKFWFRFKAVKAWQEKNFKDYLNKGFIENPFGFRIGGWLTKNDLCNYPIQGTAFHCLVWSLHTLNQRMKAEKMDSLLIGQIHDCCLAEVVPSEEDRWCQMSYEIATKEIRIANPWLLVPLDIEFERAEVDQPWSTKKEFFPNLIGGNL